MPHIHEVKATEKNYDEQIKMMVRTHRTALDFDERVCNIVLPTGTKPEVGNLRKVRKRKSTNL